MGTRDVGLWLVHPATSWRWNEQIESICYLQHCHCCSVYSVSAPSIPDSVALQPRNTLHQPDRYSYPDNAHSALEMLQQARALSGATVPRRLDNYFRQRYQQVRRVCADDEMFVCLLKVLPVIPVLFFFFPFRNADITLHPRALGVCLSEVETPLVAHSVSQAELDVISSGE